MCPRGLLLLLWIRLKDVMFCIMSFSTLRWCVDKNAFSLTPTHFYLRDGSQSQRALSLHQVSQGPQWLWPPATFLTTWNFSRSVLGSPIRPRASRLHWSVPGLLFLPNGCLDNGYMIFNNPNRSKACRGFSCPLPDPPFCKIQVLWTRLSFSLVIID